MLSGFGQACRCGGTQIQPEFGATLGEQARTRWFAKVQACGATEMHVHRLADSDTRRQAIVKDLREDESRVS